jgi:hypothetical protein
MGGQERCGKWLIRGREDRDPLDLSHDLPEHPRCQLTVPELVVLREEER